MLSPVPDAMTRDEKRAGAALASIFALRMLGLFLILPVFALHAVNIPGGDNLTLVGLALGAYGFTQAILQIPFGMASDHFGRKPVIIFGLVLFALGSVIAALANGIWWVVLGRVVQGAGAISAAVTAMAADLTREQHRTKVMAMIGSSIGLVFAASLVIAPSLYEVIGLSGLFWLTGLLATGAIFVVVYVVPEPPPPHPGAPVPFLTVLSDPQLLRLNFGIFVLHMTQFAMWIAVPGLLVSIAHIPAASHWKVYLPTVLASFLVLVPAIVFAERRGKARQVFIAAIGLLLLTEVLFQLGRGDALSLVVGLLLFFVAFNILEASLPSLIARIAPPRAKGAALGIYNTSQTLGLALGGLAGGFMARHWGPWAIFAGCAVLVLIWLMLALSMRPPPVIVRKELPITPGADMAALYSALAGLPGVREARLEAERGIVHLQVNSDLWDERRVRQLMGGEG